MANRFAIKVSRSDVVRGYFPGWREVCSDGTWTVDASHFSTPNCGAYAVLSPTGKLTCVPVYHTGSAPELDGVVEAVHMAATALDRPSARCEFAEVETDQLSLVSLVMNGDAERVCNGPEGAAWSKIAGLVESHGIVLRWVRGHGLQTSARMTVVDLASRKAARLAASLLPERFETMTDVSDEQLQSVAHDTPRWGLTRSLTGGTL